MRPRSTRCLTLVMLTGYLSALAAGWLHDHGGTPHVHRSEASSDQLGDDRKPQVTTLWTGCTARHSCAHHHRARPQPPAGQTGHPETPDVPGTPEHDDDCSVCQFLAQKPLSDFPVAVVVSAALVGRTERPQALRQAVAAVRISLPRGPPTA